jgi:excisionase family DNA binding protein
MQTINTERRTLTTPEVQAVLGLGRDEVLKLIRRGVLPNLGTPRRFRVSRAAVQRYLGES